MRSDACVGLSGGCLSIWFLLIVVIYGFKIYGSTVSIPIIFVTYTNSYD